ncbi:MAG TPA: hypothetical protein PKN21_06050 [Bacteroidales bacterium]|nr:hypothetical protein [Bacteroidales bacterium]
MPTAPEIKKYSSSPEFRTLTSKHSGVKTLISSDAHGKARKLIADNRIHEALVLLLAVDLISSADL